MIDFDKLCNEFCTGMDLYKTITKLHHMDIKYHVVNTDNTFCFRRMEEDHGTKDKMGTSGSRPPAGPLDERRGACG